MEGFIETSPPDPFSHNFVLLLSNAVSQNLYRIFATAMWKLSKISIYLYTSLFIKFFVNKN